MVLIRRCHDPITRLEPDHWGPGDERYVWATRQVTIEAVHNAASSRIQVKPH